MCTIPQADVAGSLAKLAELAQGHQCRRQAATYGARAVRGSMSLRSPRPHCSQPQRSRRRVVHPAAGCPRAGARPGHIVAGGTVQAMRQASTGPAGHPVVARLAAELIDELGALTEQLVIMLRQADEAYLAVDIEDLRRSARENLASFVGDLASQRSPSTSSSRDTARRRADQGVPLGSVLHAYRLGFHVIWDALAARALRKGRTGWTAWYAGRPRSGPG